MDIILLHNNLYQLITLSYNFDFNILNCFEYCDAFRKAMADYDEVSNRWITRDGKLFMGCMC